MSQTSHIQELDALLKDVPPSRDVWHKLCEWVEAAAEEELEESLLAHVQTLLSGWPDALRSTPSAWIARLLDGEHVPQMAIAKTLDLRCKRLIQEDAELLSESPELLWITRLNLAYNGLQSGGTRALFKSDVVRNLTLLDLSGNSIESSGIEAIAACEHLSRLEQLDLTGNWVGDDGAAKLASSPHLANLKTLVLRGNPIRKAGAQALASSPHLCEAIRQKWINL